MVDLISIIIPCYNVSLYVSECIDSVLNQSYKNIEVLCVDDKSTDDTLGILNSFSNDKRFKICKHKINKGLSATRNTGLSLAKGDYVLFLDSDDLLNVEALSKLIKAIKKYDADICFGQIQQIKNNKLLPVFSNLKGVNGCFSFEKYKSVLLGRSYVCATGKLYKRSFFDNTIISFDEGLIYEDVAPFFLAMCNARKKVVIDDVILYWRLRDGSISHQIENCENIEIYLYKVYKILKNYNSKEVRKNFLFFVANSYTWYNFTDDIRNIHIKVLQDLGYREVDLLRSCGLKRLRKLYQKKYTLMDRLRIKINKFRWYYLDK